MAVNRSHNASHAPRTTEARPHNEEAASTVNGATDIDRGFSEERMRRAEEMVDRIAEQIGNAAGRLGHGILWLAARAREEAEDIWAEARSLSRGKQP
jgi:hypothetical protein